METKNLIDIQQLATYLNISPYTIYDWIHDGKIPHIKIGTLVRFDPDAIKAWIEEHSKKSLNGKLILNGVAFKKRKAVGVL